LCKLKPLSLNRILLIVDKSTIENSIIEFSIIEKSIVDMIVEKSIC